MSELTFDAEQFKSGIQQLTDVGGRANDFNSRIEALTARTKAAAGNGSDGTSFLESLQPTIDGVSDGVGGVLLGVQNGQNNLEYMQTVLSTAESVNSDSVPKTGGSLLSAGSGSTVPLEPATVFPAVPAVPAHPLEPATVTPAVPAVPGVPLEPATVMLAVPGVPLEPATVTPAVPAVPGAPLEPATVTPAVPATPGAPLEPASVTPAVPAVPGVPLEPATVFPAVPIVSGSAAPPTRGGPAS
jgi:hypothetical protein